LSAEAKDLPVSDKGASGDEMVSYGIKEYNKGEYFGVALDLLRGLEAGIKLHRPTDIWTILGNAYVELQNIPKPWMPTSMPWISIRDFIRRG